MEFSFMIFLSGTKMICSPKSKNKKQSKNKFAPTSPRTCAVKVMPFGFCKKNLHTLFFLLIFLLVKRGSIFFVKNLDSPAPQTLGNCFLFSFFFPFFSFFF